MGSLHACVCLPGDGYADLLSIHSLSAAHTFSLPVHSLLPIHSFYPHINPNPYSFCPVGDKADADEDIDALLAAIDGPKPAAAAPAADAPAAAAAAAPAAKEEKEDEDEGGCTLRTHWRGVRQWM